VLLPRKDKENLWQNERAPFKKVSLIRLEKIKELLEYALSMCKISNVLSISIMLLYLTKKNLRINLENA
jgi:hypothetical protein